MWKLITFFSTRFYTCIWKNLFSRNFALVPPYYQSAINLRVGCCNLVIRPIPCLWRSFLRALGVSLLSQVNGFHRKSLKTLLRKNWSRKDMFLYLIIWHKVYEFTLGICFPVKMTYKKVHITSTFIPQDLQNWILWTPLIRVPANKNWNL